MGLLARREFLALAGATAAFPRFAFAQQSGKLPRIALTSTLPITSITTTGDPSWAAFIQELARQGFVERRTVTLDRYQSNATIAQDVARSIFASAPDMIFSGGTDNLAALLMAQTNTIPIVAESGDPLGIGLVNNLANPGGNLTAVSTSASADAEAKRLALLSEAVPTAKKLAYISGGVSGQVIPVLQGYVRSVTDAAPTLGLAVITILLDNPVDEASCRKAVAAAVNAKVEMIQFGVDAPILAYSSLLAMLSFDARMPAISPYSAFAEAGGMLSYGASIPDTYRQAAGYVALILNGARPGDLPVLQPTAFDFIVNLKTSKTVGVTIPESLLVQATRVIS